MKISKIFIIITLIIIFMGGLVLTDNESSSQNDPPHGTGLKMDEEGFNESKISVSPNLLAKGFLEVEKDYTSDMPPIGNQGQIGSCVAWALGYSIKSYQEHIEHNTDYSESSLVSPSFIYNSLNGGEDDGLVPSHALDFMKREGCLTLKEMPYTQDYKKKPPRGYEDVKERYKIASYNRLTKEFNRWFSKDFHTDEDIENIKNIIATEGPVEISAHSPYSMQNFYFNGDDVYDISDFTPGETVGGHAMVIVGYNDNKSGGAFKIMNSWGEDYAGDGYFWITYEAAKSLMRTTWRVVDVPSDPPPDIIVKKVMDIEIEVKPSGNRRFEDKMVEYNEKTGFYDVDYEFNLRDRFRLRITPKESFSVYFINIDPEGNIKLIYPTGNNSSWVQPDTYYFPPDSYKSYSFTSRGGSGIEHIVIIASSEELDQYNLGNSNNLSKNVMDNLNNIEDLKNKAFPEIANKDNVGVYSIRLQSNK
jgi:hypothetical protein